MYLFWNEEGILEQLKKFNIDDYSEEKGCNCPLCDAIRFRKVKKNLGI